LRQPLKRLGIFRAPNLAAANIAQLLLGAAWIPMFFFVNLYLQQILGLGAFASGAALLPLTVTIMIGMVAVAPKLIARFGPNAMVVSGLATLAAGLVWLSFIDADGSFLVDILPASLVTAAGMAMAFIPSLGTALSACGAGGGRPGRRDRQHQLPDRLRARPRGHDRGRGRVRRRPGRQPGRAHRRLLRCAARRAGIAAVGAVLAACCSRQPADTAAADSDDDELVAPDGFRTTSAGAARPSRPRRLDPTRSHALGSETPMTSARVLAELGERIARTAPPPTTCTCSACRGSSPTSRPAPPPH
jgi:hypothetical protein